jgi:hypothetical protein
MAQTSAYPTAPVNSNVRPQHSSAVHKARMKKILALIPILLAGCASNDRDLGYKEFYSQTAPSKYPPPARTMTFAYENADINDLYNILFSDYLIIGKSGFNGPFEDPANASNYANSIGSDVFISMAQLKETKTSFYNIQTPTSSTTRMNGFSGGTAFSGTATTYGTQTTSIPIVINRYDQHGLFLRNINKVTPLWERTNVDYPKNSPTEASVSWENERYNILTYHSSSQIVGFIEKLKLENDKWKEGELKFSYDEKTGTGIYLMGNKAPMPAKFSINKFGHLEVSLYGGTESFSFAPIKSSAHQAE